MRAREPGIAELARVLPVPAEDIDGLARAAVGEQVELVVVGPEAPLVTARGLSFTASRVQGVRFHWKIPRYQPGDSQPGDGQLLNVSAAARQLGIAPSTLLRWLDMNGGTATSRYRSLPFPQETSQT